MIVQPQEMINQRYQIKHLLGQGGMGAVYQAYDNQQARDVAIKILTLPPGESQLRFRREFRVMQRLQHQHIVPSYDSGVHEDMPFLVMELIAGGDLNKNFMVKEEARAITSLEQLPLRLEIAIQIAEALAYIHQQGIIHRDLKPENIMLAQAVDCEAEQPHPPHIFLMDFGLVKTNSETMPLTQAGMVMGTVGYMSPEQAQGREVDSRSDLYALGSLIYWLILGHPAYQGKNAIETLFKQLREPPQVLSQYLAFIPPQLDMLVLRLLEKLPSDRYNDGSDVALALRGVLQEVVHKLQERMPRAATQPSEPLATNTPPPLKPAGILERTPAKLFQAPLIGRESIFQRLAKVLQHAHTSQAHVIAADNEVRDETHDELSDEASVSENSSMDSSQRHFLLQAETGMGVTRLLNELRREARSHKHLVLHLPQAQGVVSPYQSWQHALRRLKRQKSVLFARISQGLHDPLSTLLPELGGAGIDNHLPAEIAQNRLHQAVDTLLRRLVAESSLVLFVDNLHSSDQASLALLRYVLRGASREHIISMMGVDFQDLTTETRGIIQDFEATTIRLQPLNRDDVRSLIYALLGSESVDAALEHYVVERANGSPFFVGEILTALLEAKQIHRQAGAWVWDRTRVSLPPSIGALFLERLYLLTKDVQDTALAASAIGNEFHFEVLRDLLEYDENVLLDQLDVLLRAGFLREVGEDSYRFVNVLFREVLHNYLPRRQYYRYHEKIAALLLEREDSSVVQLADHYAETLQPERCIPFALQAGNDAEKVFANDISEKYYRLALEHVLPDEPLKHDISLRLGKVLERIGHWQEAEELYTSVQHASAYRSQALHALGRLYQKQGDLAKSETYLRDALAIAEAKLEIYSDLGRTLTYKADLKEARDIYTEALALVMGLEIEEEKKGRMVARAQLDLGLLEHHSGNWQTAIQWLETAEEQLDENKDRLLIAQLKHRLGISYQELYQHDIAEKSLSTALEIYNAIGDIERGLAIMINIANDAFYKGSYVKAEQMYHETEIKAYQIGEKKIQAIALINQGIILSEKGDFAKAATTLRKSAKLFEAIGFIGNQVIAYTGMVTCFTRLHQFDLAKKNIDVLDELFRAYHHDDKQTTMFLVKGEWYLRQGLFDEAETLFQKVVEQGNESIVEVVAEAQIFMAQLYLRRNQDITGILQDLHATIQYCDDMALKLLASYLQAIHACYDKEREALENQFRENGLYHHMELFNKIMHTSSP